MDREVLDVQGEERQKNGQLLVKLENHFVKCSTNTMWIDKVEMARGIAIRGIKLMFSPSFPLIDDDPVALNCSRKA